MSRLTSHPPPAGADRGQPEGARRRLDSTQLLAGAGELIITHGNEEYRLRLTRQGKLILTK